MLVCLTYRLSQWSLHRLTNQKLLLRRVCIQGFVMRYCLNRLPRVLTLAIPTKVILVLDKALKIHTK